MLDTYAFYLLAPLIVICALLIYPQKRLIRAVIALTGAFVGSAILFLLLGQTLIALLMIIIFVGGLSTYLIVAVATEEKATKLISLPYFFIVLVVFFAVMLVLLNYLPVANSSTSTPSFLDAAASAFQSSYPTLYLIVILLFSVTIGGTLIIRKFARLIV